jgi:DNA-binding NarL/FixJ family response regulator
VASAPTADEGLRKAQEGIFDLVLVDISLPDQRGLEVLKSLNRESPETAVMMITAYDSSQVAFRASKEGA